MSFHNKNHCGNVANGITVDHEKEHLEHIEQDPKLFGPGYSVHDSNIRYLLVSPEMVDAMRHGRTPNTDVLPPSVGKVEQFDGYPPSLDAMYDKFAIQHVEHHGARDSDSDNASHVPPSPMPYLVNPLSRFRYQYKEYLGEFIGTMVLIIFGNGVNCQVVLGDLTQGSYLSISFGWGIGVMFGVYACGGVSGAHINPAVTITLATFRGFPWRKVPGYALAQILGACLGSALIQGNYHALLNQFEGGYNLRTYGLDTSTGALFFTAAKPYMSNIGAFCSELFATAILLALIFAIGDQNNNPVPSGMNGFALLFLIIGIGAALGTEASTAYCLNPARDLGPRIACAMFGYPKEIWMTRHCYWIYVPIIATICGGVLGGFLYDVFIFQGKESPLNRPWGRLKKQIEVGGNIDAAQNA